MAEKEKKQRSRLRRNLMIGATLVIVLIVSAAGYLSNLYGRFQQDFNRLSEAMANGDSDTVEKQIDAMAQYHDLATKWHLASFVDQHLLQNMYIYKAANTFLRGDFRSFNDDRFLIQKANDSHLVANILGLAKARYYQGLYQEKLNQIKAKKKEPDKEDKADLDTIVKKVIEEARPYFKMAVENSPGNDLYFEYPFNYDILQSEDSTRQALENPGPLGQQDEPMGYGDSDKPGNKPKTGDKSKGKGGGKEGKPDKLNPGGQKPGGEGQPRKPKG